MLVFRGYSLPSHGATVLTIGNFDGVHQGHRALLRRLTAAAADVGLPATVLTFEPHPREFFAPDAAPARLTTLREKLELLADDGVDRVCVCHFNRRFAALSAADFVDDVLVASLRVNHLIVGDDFRFGAGRAGDFACLSAAARRHGFRIEAMDSISVDGERVSSSAVRDALQAGKLDYAAQLLGRPYAIDGRVVRGAQLGRQLGFATANIRIKHERPPLHGVFAVEVKGLAGGPHVGVANLGVRPTAHLVPRPLLEVHLLNFAAEIYGAHLSVRFLHKLRDEIKFPSLDALKTQIAYDVAAAKAHFQL